MTMSTERIDRFASAPMLQLMGMNITFVGEGMATVTALPDHKYDNQMVRMHGGYAATLIDTVMGCAVMSRLPEKTGYGTIDLNVKFVRKIDVDSGLLTATATVLHAGRTMLTAEAKVVDAQGKLCAHGSGTFLVYPKQAT
jgi:acyl-CoA thioesterase